MRDLRLALRVCSQEEQRRREELHPQLNVHMQPVDRAVTHATSELSLSDGSQLSPGTIADGSSGRAEDHLVAAVCDGVDLDRVMPDTMNRLAINGDVETMHACWKLGIELDGPPAADGSVPLVTGAFYGRRALVSLLMEFGADVNRTDGFGMTALIAAAGMGHTDILMILLEANADISIASANGRTALGMAGKGLRSGLDGGWG